MNLEKHIKDISDRLDKISNNGNGNDSNENDEFKDYDDEYYLDIKSEPPRFAYYRQVWIDKCTDEYRKKTFECVHDSITQDELDYYLKAKLRVSSEERYQDKKKEPWWHESSYIKRTGKDGYDGYGCHHLYGCIPECRFYAEYGKNRR